MNMLVVHYLLVFLPAIEDSPLKLLLLAVKDEQLCHVSKYCPLRINKYKLYDQVNLEKLCTSKDQKFLSNLSKKLRKFLCS